MTKNIFLSFVVLLACVVTPAAAQQNDKPLEITADRSLEWHRNDRQFIARDNAMARQGDVSVAAATLTADYQDTRTSGFDISRVVAEGNVVISSRDNTAYGQSAVYNVKTGLARMTGDTLRMVGPDQTVTAKDSFEYNLTAGRLLAKGDASVTRKNERGELNTLEADTIIAVMKDNPNGKRTLQSLEAEGNVVITTPTEIVTGAYGLYKADTNSAVLTGGVTIKRGPNILQGEKAEVDLNTNTSRMFGDKSDGGRVRGVFYPNSENKAP